METIKEIYESFKAVSLRFSGVFVAVIILILWGGFMITDVHDPLAHKKPNIEKPDIIILLEDLPS